jgi:DGQHR domain-containing protein
MEDTYSIDLPAFIVKQRPTNVVDVDFCKESDFFVFSMPSNELLKIAKFTSRSESKLGFQRQHNEERDKQIGNFITSDFPFFPNTIIINLPPNFEDEYFIDGNLRLTIPLKSAYVIDGQHRLKAFESSYSNGVVLDLVVSAYFGLERPTIAEIFTRINFFQKPVSKSLVYDLLDLNNDKEFQKYKEAHQIVEILNESIKSPFYKLIKILGIGDGLISQAAIVEAFTTRYKILDFFKEVSKENKVSIINSFYNSIRQSFGDKWGNPRSILTRTMGFNAMTKVLKAILQYEKDKADQDGVEFVASQIDFHYYVNNFSDLDIDSEEYTSLGGFKGVNTLFDSIYPKLFKKGE